MRFCLGHPANKRRSYKFNKTNNCFVASLFKERALSIPTAQQPRPRCPRGAALPSAGNGHPGQRCATSRMPGFHLMTATCWACPVLPLALKESVISLRKKMNGQNFQISRNPPVIGPADRTAFSFGDGFQCSLPAF